MGAYKSRVPFLGGAVIEIEIRGGTQGDTRRPPFW